MIRVCREELGPVTAFALGRPVLGRVLMEVRVYLVGRTLIDTGMPHAGREVMEIARRHGVRQAIVTHHHEDHSGNAAALAAAGVRILATPATAERLRSGWPLRFYQRLVWGVPSRFDGAAPLPERFEDEGLSVQAIPTPGHAEDMVAFHDRARGWLFSGDNFLAERVRYFRRDELFEPALESLRRLAALDFDALFCAHAPRPTGGRAALAAKLAYLEELRGRVLDAAGRGLDEPAITREVLGRDRFLRRLLVGGDVSSRNLVHRILEEARLVPG
jgi:glyoxylase-like metal-dependent hydrolase (beta-lactamase superfamily II)